MLTGKGIVADPDAPDLPQSAARQRPFWRRIGRPQAPGRRAVWRQLLIVLSWIGLGTALFALLVRISLRSLAVGDDANLALQGWDMLHGNLMLHGWILGDVTYYTFELPLYAIAERLIGLRTADIHVAAALAYLIVAALAVALARTGSRGLAAAARSAVVITVLAAPLILAPGVILLLEVPDHFGTSVFLLGSFLLIDKAAGRWFTAPLAGVILWVGQLGDATVRYIAVPAILVVCAYRVLAERKLRTYDTAVALAAVASVPLSLLTRAAMRHAGAYAAIRPKTAIAPGRTVGASRAPGGRGPQAAVRGGPWPPGYDAGRHSVHPWSCLPARRCGRLRAGGLDLAGREPGRAAAGRHDRGLPGRIHGFPVPGRLRDLRRAGVRGRTGRACVRACADRQPAARLGGLRRGRSCRHPAAGRRGRAAAREPGTGSDHGLARCPRIQVRPGLVLGLIDDHGGLGRPGPGPGGPAPGSQARVRRRWYTEARPDWYSASLHRATFVIAGRGSPRFNLAHIKRVFGRPVAIYDVAGWVIVSYRKNLLVTVATIPQVTYGHRLIG